MDSYRETFNTWNKVAKMYEEQFMPLQLYHESYAVFCKLIKIKNASLLELACGPGNITKYLSEERPDLRIEAIDIAPEMIALAKKNCPAVDFRIMDIREINQIQKKYDALLCGFGLPYLSQADCRNLLASAYALLCDNGLLYLSYVEGDYAQSGYQTGSSGDRTYFYYYSSVDMIQYLKSQNFKIVKQVEVWYPKNPDEKEIHSIIIAQK